MWRGSFACSPLPKSAVRSASARRPGTCRCRWPPLSLILSTYLAAIIAVQASRDTEAGEARFPTVPTAMGAVWHGPEVLGCLALACTIACLSVLAAEPAEAHAAEPAEVHTAKVAAAVESSEGVQDAAVT